MGIDTSIYANLLRPPKSVAEYDNERMAGQQNKLALTLNQQKVDEYTRGIGEADRLRGVVSNFGSDQTANYNALLQAGRLDKAQEYRKSNADLGETQGKLDKQKVELIDAKLKQSRSYLDGVTTPEQFIAWHEGNHKDPVLGPELAARGVTAAQARASIMEAIGRPGGFEELLNKSRVGIEKFTEMNKPTFQTRNTGATTDTLQLPGMGGAPTIVNSIKNTQSPDSIATNATTRRGQNLTEARGQQVIDIARNQKAPGGKPLPPTALKMQQEELDGIGIASGIQADLGAIEKQINAGKLDFGLFTNLADKGLNFAGMSTENSRNLASFRATLEKLRNDSLRLNKGVQTDGDSQRAWNELFENINDKKMVKQRLDEIKRINERAVKLRRMNVDSIRSNYGHDPMDTSGYENQAPTVGGQPSMIDDLLKKYGD